MDPATNGWQPPPVFDMQPVTSAELKQLAEQAAEQQSRTNFECPEEWAAAIGVDLAKTPSDYQAHNGLEVVKPVAIAVTATRQGLTLQQKHTLEKLLDILPRAETLTQFQVYHGAALGGDQQVAEIFHRRRAELGVSRIVAFPSDIPTQVSIRSLMLSDEKKEPAPPLARNATMVRDAWLVLAFPARATEEVRSGTWATIRNARRWGLYHMIVWPNGACESFNVPSPESAPHCMAPPPGTSGPSRTLHYQHVWG